MTFVPTLAIHLKTDLLSSESSLQHKLVGSSLLFNNMRAMSPTFENQYFLSGPRESPYDIIAEPHSFHIPNRLSSSNKSFKRAQKEERLSTQLLNKSVKEHNSVSALSPTLEGRKLNAKEKTKKLERPGRRLVGSEVSTKEVLNMRNPTEVKGGGINSKIAQKEIKEEAEVLESPENIQETHEEIEKEMIKKEQIIEIYKKLIALCKKQQISRITTIDLGEKNKISDERNLGSLKARKIVRRAEANSSFSSLLLQKSTQPTLSKTSFFERLDSKLNLNGGDFDNTNKEDISYQHSMSFKKPNTKKQKANETITAVQSRLRKGVLAHFMKISNRMRDKQHLLSKINDDSVVSPMKTYDQTSAYLSESTIFEGGEGSLEGNQKTTFVNYQESNIKMTKEDALNNVADRIDYIFWKYKKESLELYDRIQILEYKISQLQAVKSKKN